MLQTASSDNGADQCGRWLTPRS